MRDPLLAIVVAKKQTLYDRNRIDDSDKRKNEEKRRESSVESWCSIL